MTIHSADLSYVIVTPARNEAEFINLTLGSVIAQTIKPLKWIIVSDGSTDGTDEIVAGYVARYPFIELLRMPERKERHFAGKVHAFNAGYEKLKDVQYDLMCSLDADISFDSDYFEFLLRKCAEEPGLGVTGTPFREGRIQYDYRFSRKEHVSGACQLFRRECFEAIGGYLPLKTGGIDLTAVVMARMHGWKTETFTEKFCVHHRRMGSAKDGALAALFKSGYYDYPMGVHPLWQISRSFYQMSRKPLMWGGLTLMVGYFWAMLTCSYCPVSPEFIRFRRAEQMRWLREYIRRSFRPVWN